MEAEEKPAAEGLAELWCPPVASSAILPLLGTAKTPVPLGRRKERAEDWAPLMGPSEEPPVDSASEGFLM